MATAVYARTSKENNDGSYSTSSQVDFCLEYAASNNLNVIDTYVFREDYSGTVIDRPEIAKVRQLVKNRKIDSLVIYSTDRLARDITVGSILFDEMCKHGVNLHIVRWGGYVRNDNASEKFRFNVEMSVSDFEKENIKERLMRGKIKKASMGKLVPHSRPRYGYSVNELKDNLVLNDYSPVVKFIFESYGLKQVNPSKIAEELNLRGVPTPGNIKGNELEASAHKKLKMGMINQEKYEKLLSHADWARGDQLWSPSVIHTILANVRNYTGNYTFTLKGVTYTVHPEPIISVEVAEAVETMLSLGSKRFARKEGVSRYLMARRLSCTCGRSYGVRPNKSKYFDGYYSCMTRVHTYGKKNGCTNKPIRNDVLDPMAKEFVKELFLHPDRLFAWWEKQHEKDENANIHIKEEIAQVDAKIVELQKKLRKTLDRLTDNLDDDEVAIYTEQKENIKKMLAGYRKRKEELEGSLVTQTVSEETVRAFAEMGDEYREILEEIHEPGFWRTLVDKIDLTGEIGTDEKGQYIDFIVFSSKRKRDYINNTESAGS